MREEGRGAGKCLHVQPLELDKVGLGERSL